MRTRLGDKQVFSYKFNMMLVTLQEFIIFLLFQSFPIYQDPNVGIGVPSLPPVIRPAMSTHATSSFSIYCDPPSASAATTATAAPTATASTSNSSLSGKDWAVGPLAKLPEIQRIEEERRRRQRLADERLDRSIAAFQKERRNPLETLSQDQDGEITFNVSKMFNSNFLVKGVQK